jgi:hypothetical protein
LRMHTNATLGIDGRHVFSFTTATAVMARHSSAACDILGIEQVRTPFRAPRANAISERWVKSVRSGCLDHLFIFNEACLRRVMASYVSYFNHWRPHRSLGQRAPRDSTVLRSRAPNGKITQRTSSADCITSIGARHDGRHFCALRLVPQHPTASGLVQSGTFRPCKGWTHGRWTNLVESTRFSSDFMLMPMQRRF